MHLNTISGRTYNDLNQYPVFPWVISDYKPEPQDYDLLEVVMSRDPNHPDAPRVFRDLSKPVGALNAERMKSILERFEASHDTNMPPFHYGSHYSNPGIVLFYLLRLEPFSSLHIELQGGKFDYPDRLFTSVEQVRTEEGEENREEKTRQDKTRESEREREKRERARCIPCQYQNNYLVQRP